ncbi:MAG: polysaccharide biosynthesis protein [Clostridia bacterium]|nr:polysaccharide biosynthesis protein [Clostridia bacterium]
MALFFMNRVSYGQKPGGFVYVVLCMFTIVLITLSRAHLKYRFSDNDNGNENLFGNIMVIGGGSAGSTIINDIFENKRLKNCEVKCVIDDDLKKAGQYISGVQIAGTTTDIIRCADKYKIDTIIFAIPTCPNDRKSLILEMCQKTGCKIKIVPSIYQFLSDETLNVSSVREVEIEDLLGREPFDKDINDVGDYIADKTALVTGGGGSIGSELCRQIAEQNPKLLIILDIYENSAYDIQNELKHDYPELNLITLIASVRDSKRMDYIFSQYKPDIVFHAAAHKHVPLMEENPNEAIKNNVFGTYKTALCASKYNVHKFVLISTDKAVNPTNIMGASKRICEMIVQMFNHRSNTDFVAVRFGNVLGSNGSVIPLFKKQISEGGPVTVTDPNIIRYFMTIPEAVSLVLKAGSTAKGGEIFVLDMGKPVKIVDLAEKLIQLSGFKPYVDIPIEFTGLRPGEKLYEEMLMSEEGLQKTDNNLIYIGKPIEFDEKKLEDALTLMKDNMYNDDFNIKAVIKEIVPTYSYTK